jgi:hypothetical protein
MRGIGQLNLRIDAVHFGYETISRNRRAARGSVVSCSIILIPPRSATVMDIQTIDRHPSPRSVT